MRGSLLNINLSLISNKVIVEIAKDLGCHIEEPIRKENIYSKYILDKLMKNEVIEEDLFYKEKIENENIEKDYKSKYNICINDVLWWLEENGYMKYE